jgi:hypothetical protein
MRLLDEVSTRPAGEPSTAPEETDDVPAEVVDLVDPSNLGAASYDDRRLRVRVRDDDDPS